MSRRREIPEEDRIYIRQASELLDRRIGTLRKWEADGVLPKTLCSRRGKKNWRYWTADQIEGIKAWIVKTNRQPGSGLPHLAKRDIKDAEKQVHAMRKPRTKSTTDTNEAA